MDMCEITDKIELLVGKDKNGKAMILMSKLIEDNFNSLNKKQESTTELLKEINSNISSISSNKQDICKLQHDMKNLEVVSFFSKYPKLAKLAIILIFLAVILAYTTGIKTLIGMI